ncbi:MAG: hypothetical protein JWO22_1039 [Frankiales bacterium]|nr:hypothetical protein [Frankiales bacterium]
MGAVVGVPQGSKLVTPPRYGTGHYPARVTSRRLLALAALPVLLGACSSGSTSGAAPTAPPATAPVPGVTLPPGAGSQLVPLPDEVPAGMILIVKGSGARDLQTVAGYSGTGTGAGHDQAVAAAAAKLRAHGFQQAYVAQYLNQTTGAVVSVVASTYATAAGAAADYADDAKATTGELAPTATIGDASSAHITPVRGKVAGELLLLRFRKSTTTWSLAYQSAPKVDVGVAVALALKLVSRAT